MKPPLPISLPRLPGGLTLLFLACSAIAALQAAEVPWLKAVVTPPADLPRPHPPLQPVLITAQGEPIRDLQTWQTQRERLRQAWLELLGPLPQPPEPIRTELVETETLPRCTRMLIRYEAEPDRWVRAYLLRPLGETQGQRAGVVVFHGTNAQTIQTVGGVAGDPDRHIAPRLAEQGFVVLCPENFLWEESSYKKSVQAARKRHPHSRGMATMLADGMRAVDVLLAQPDVDPEKIGALGHSLGAKETMYLTAFDDRVKSGVASEGGVGMTFTNWDADWYLGPDCRTPEFAHDHHELLALIAPRPFLVFAGETGRGCADGVRTWPYVRAGQEVAQLYGGPVRMGLWNHGEGHAFSHAAGERAIDWLKTTLN